MPTDDPTYRPDMPDFGFYPLWPESGDHWYHPEDAQNIEQLVPSRRVLRRTGYDGEFYLLEYGARRVRVRPTMWLGVPSCDLEVDQAVEVLARQGLNEVCVGIIAEMLYNDSSSQIEFVIRCGQMNLSKRFSRQDLQPLSIKHNLRVGFYEHLKPSCDPAFMHDRLDVGNLLAD